MYNLRYHLASLVAVFLALAIGVILGGLIVDNSSAFDTDRIIRDLQTQYDQLRGDNDALTAQSEALEQLSGVMMTTEYGAALSGKTVGVLSTDKSVSDHAVQALEGAGAVAVSIDLDSPRLDLADAESDLVVALKAAGVDVAGGEGEIARSLAREWTSSVPTATPVTAALIDAGVLDIAGVDGVGTFVPSLVGIVNMAVSEELADSFALEIAAAFQENGDRAVGASMIGGTGSVATASWDIEIPGVSTMGSSLGSYSIVALMSGAEPGLYGLVDGADAAFAEMPAAAQP